MLCGRTNYSQHLEFYMHNTREYNHIINSVEFHIRFSDSEVTIKSWTWAVIQTRTVVHGEHTWRVRSKYVQFKVSTLLQMTSGVKVYRNYEEQSCVLKTLAKTKGLNLKKRHKQGIFEDELQSTTTNASSVCECVHVGDTE